jgi:plastocyanin
MATPMRFLTPLLVAAVVVPVALSGCGSDTSGSNGGRYDTTTAAPASTVATASTAATTTSGTSSVTVALVADPNGALMFDTTTLTAKAGTVTIALRNPSTSGMPHAIAVKGNGVDNDGPTVQPGGTSRVTVTLTPGTYSYYCPVAGHEAGGMKGTLTVTA